MSIEDNEIINAWELALSQDREDFIKMIIKRYGKNLIHVLESEEYK